MAQSGTMGEGNETERGRKERRKRRNIAFRPTHREGERGGGTRFIDKIYDNIKEEMGQASLYFGRPRHKSDVKQTAAAGNVSD